MRLFYALWPDEATRSALSYVLNDLEGRQTRIANLHITLAFLGEQPASNLPALHAILNELPAPDLKLIIDRLGYFSRQRIAWAGMQEVPDELHALHKALSEKLERHNIAYDRRSDFKPHITLARDAAPPSATLIEPIIWHANHIGLMQSVMQPEGVSYQVIASCVKGTNSGNV